LIKQVLNLIVKADLIVLSDYAKGCLTENLLAFVMAEAKKNDKRVLVDPKSRDFTKYNGATILTPNLSEALTAADSQDLNEAVEKIFAETEIESLLITLGENGMKFFKENETPTHFPATARQVFDVTGAGDTVIATLAVALA
jgi:D-beta-D-heptose 7-phosphate kinase/D-beta-D-heptose 1-phosphate adenosyltransferase